ncbi:TPA: hypothetical protein NJY08_004425 [Salmonella enterica subsp. enterica serovar Typhi str. AG3]|nr:hypothetical protein [Salmonella enterica subsp. enterica serovar Typhi str. AG3]
MFKRNKIEVVAPRDYSNSDVMAYYGGRSVEESKTDNNNIAPLMIGTSVITLNTLFNSLKSASAATGEWAVQTAPSTTTIPTGFVADASLNMLATILDPIIQIMVAVSFPLASVIMVGAGFFFMLGNSERAWDIIFKCGMGYIFIQISPMLLEILRQIGTAI